MVNLNYHNAASVILNGPGAMDVFEAPAQVWRAQPGGKRIKLDSPAGGGVLVRLKK